MKDVCTVNALLLPMMGRPSVRRPYCAVCGAAGMPLNQHHIVRRGAGRLVVGGEEAEKPTVTLCGGEARLVCVGAGRIVKCAECGAGTSFAAKDPAKEWNRRFGGDGK